MVWANEDCSILRTRLEDSSSICQHDLQHQAGHRTVALCKLKTSEGVKLHQLDLQQGALLTQHWLDFLYEQLVHQINIAAQIKALLHCCVCPPRLCFTQEIRGGRTGRWVLGSARPCSRRRTENMYNAQPGCCTAPEAHCRRRSLPSSEFRSV